MRHTFAAQEAGQLFSTAEFAGCDHQCPTAHRGDECVQGLPARPMPCHQDAGVVVRTIDANERGGARGQSPVAYRHPTGSVRGAMDHAGRVIERQRSNEVGFGDRCRIARQIRHVDPVDAGRHDGLVHGEHGHGTGIREQIFDPFAVDVRVQRNGGGPASRHGPHGDHLFQRGGHDDRDGVFRADPTLDQSAGEPVGPIV